MFTMNFGYIYAQRPERQGSLARNGRGETSLTFVKDGSQAFIDPYSQQAKTDYMQLVQAVLKRRPDGMLFDYIRYPRGEGSDSVVTKVEDLWIYSDAAKQALYDRAANNKGRELIARYLSKGSISARDVADVNQLYPTEQTPLWQGRTPSPTDTVASLQWQLYQLSVAHAAQGVLDFLSLATNLAQRNGIRAGAYFSQMVIKRLVEGGMIPDYSLGIDFRVRLSGIRCLTASVGVRGVLMIWSSELWHGQQVALR
jgi:hypothetical protein